MIITAFTIVFILICIALIVVVLMQEGKSAGLGALTGQADSYVRKNHGRTREGRLERATVILGVMFFVIAIGLELKFFQ